jgi:hypothetical protein
MSVSKHFDLRALQRDPGIAFYFRNPLQRSDFHELRQHGRLLRRFAAKPLFGRLTGEGKIDRSISFNGHIAIIFLPARARTARSADLLFTQLPPERVASRNRRRNWPMIRAAAAQAVRRKLAQWG